MEPALLDVRREGAVAHVVLSRPEVRNAFNAALIAALHAAFDDLGKDDAVVPPRGSDRRVDVQAFL